MPVFALLALLSVSYQDVEIEGWRIRVDAAVPKDQPALWQASRQELARQLQGIARVVPDKPLAEIRKVTIWVHEKSPENVCMAYHPGAQWLRDHKVNPDMAKGVEIGNLSNFISWTHHQPWMVMHEMAHAYHDRVLENGFENPVVKEAYRKAMDAKLYESVLIWDGKKGKHYACNNQMEYFAEMTEAYFGTNDFFPFVRAELMAHDEGGHGLMKAVWGEPQKRLFTTQPK